MNYLQKHFGQNFLIDNNIIKKIVNAIETINTQLAIEIGPGKGALTNELLKKYEYLVLIEIDKNLCAFLDNYFQAYKEKITIINFDFIELEKIEVLDILNKIGFSYKKINFFSNLPYSASSQIIIKMLDYYDLIDNCIFMLQKEVADRLTAQPNTNEYNALTVLLNSFFEIKQLFNVSPNCFSPKPKVLSTVILLKPLKKNEIEISNDLKEYNYFLHSAFAYKRKTLFNSLVNSKYLDKKKLLAFFQENNIDLNLRAEQLEIDKLINLFKKIKRIL